MQKNAKVALVIMVGIITSIVVYQFTTQQVETYARNSNNQKVVDCIASVVNNPANSGRGTWWYKVVAGDQCGKDNVDLLWTNEFNNQLIKRDYGAAS